MLQSTYNKLQMLKLCLLYTQKLFAEVDENIDHPKSNEVIRKLKFIVFLDDQSKISKEESLKLTPDQVIDYDNDTKTMNQYYKKVQTIYYNNIDL